MPPRPDQSRGNKIELEESWRDLLHAMWREVKAGDHPKARGKTTNMIEFGEMLARAVGRGEAFSDATVSRFLKGEQVTDDVAKAFSAFFDLPYPVLAARSVAEVRWFRAGQALRDADPQQFEDTLADLEKHAASIAETRRSLASIRKRAAPPDQSRVLHSVNDDAEPQINPRAPGRRPRRVDPDR